MNVCHFQIFAYTYYLLMLVLLLQLKRGSYGKVSSTHALLETHVL